MEIILAVDKLKRLIIVYFTGTCVLFLSQRLRWLTLASQWVVQERLLSPHVLHFGRDQVAWESRITSFNSCEVFPLGFPDNDGRFESDVSNLKPLTYWNLDEPKPWYPKLSYNAILNDWDKVVEFYTRCSLTHAGDKLFALDGLASMFKRHFKDDIYIMGLWRSQFPTCLLWHVQDSTSVDSTPRRMSELKFLPSWSWASVSGEIRMPSEVRCEGELLINNFTLQQLPQSNSIMGQHDGYISLSMHGRLQAIEQAEWWSWESHTHTTMYTSVLRPYKGYLAKPYATCIMDDREDFTIRWINSSPYRQRNLCRFLLLLCPVYVANHLLGATPTWYIIEFYTILFITLYAPRWIPCPLFRPRCHGLYLLAIKTSFLGTMGLVVERKQEGAYRRVGYFKIDKSEMKKVSCLDEVEISLV